MSDQNDIVIRLRDLLGKCQTAPAMTVWSRDLREAADEIERLRRRSENLEDILRGSAPLIEGGME